MEYVILGIIVALVVMYPIVRTGAGKDMVRNIGIGGFILLLLLIVAAQLRM